MCLDFFFLLKTIRIGSNFESLLQNQIKQLINLISIIYYINIYFVVFYCIYCINLISIINNSYVLNIIDHFHSITLIFKYICIIFCIKSIILLCMYNTNIDKKKNHMLHFECPKIDPN